MHKDCRIAVIAISGAIGLAAAIIVVGVSSGTIMSRDNGYRLLKTTPVAEPQSNEFGKPDFAPFRFNRS